MQYTPHSLCEEKQAEFGALTILCLCGFSVYVSIEDMNGSEAPPKAASVFRRQRRRMYYQQTTVTWAALIFAVFQKDQGPTDLMCPAFNRLLQIEFQW